MTAELRQALNHVANRYRRVRLHAGLAACWAAGALAALGLALIVNRADMAPVPAPRLLFAFALMVALAGLASTAFALRAARDRRWVARRVEARYPDLGAGLLAAIEQDEATPSGQFGFLQSAVIRQAITHSRRHDWGLAVPPRNLRAAYLAHAASTFALLIATGFLAARAWDRPDAGPARAALARAYSIQVEPGDAEVERGSSLLVVARFEGAVPVDARLVMEPKAQGEAGRAVLPMVRSLEDPTFVGRVDATTEDFTYKVEFQGEKSDAFQVKVFDYPELVRADASLDFPAYTSLEPKVVQDVRHVTAVEGTKLGLTFRVNKAMAKASLVDEQGHVSPLAPDTEDPTLYKQSMTLADTHRYKLQLVDREGRANKLPADLLVNVTRNRPPVVAMVQPKQDARVSPVEELTLKAKLEDDFGVVRHGISYATGGDEPKDVVLAPSEKPSKAVAAEHLLDFEAFHAEPDQLVSFFFWAEDIGPDGKPRRTSGDMYFAEVRPFDEIFRQGEPPPSSSSESQEQQQGNAEQASQLAELQKEIINATWKLVRRDIGSSPSEKDVEDARLLTESQQAAIKQAGELGERIDDPASKENLDKAVAFMTEAARKLGEAAASPAEGAHRKALSPEQAAYQALLKLRAREFEVVRANQRQQSRQGGGRNAASPSQQQINQLELKNDENRYEEQAAAQARENLSQREREQSEDRQVANRLKELAQRQNDMSERLKELQSALEAAQTAEARAEIERQLKRLREQQQQILRDTDELRERMEREENRDRLAQAREEVEQGREHVRQASEALEEGKLSQAINESARASQQMNDLREEMRKNSSDRFAEDLASMRGQARRLDETQDKLTEQLDAWKDQPERSLRESPERKQVGESFKQQKQEYEELVERMRQTGEEAQESEPLLAKELFDAVKGAAKQPVAEALNQAERLVDAGVPEQAGELARKAGEGISQVREGIERAAESVLGDETAALKRARAELDQLADQISREIAQATGQNPSQGEGEAQPQPDQGQQSGEAQEPGEQGQQGQQKGEQGQQKGQQGQQKGQQGQGKSEQGQQKGEQGQGKSQGGQPQQGQPGQQQGGGSLRGGERQAASPQGGGGPRGGLDRLVEAPAGAARGPITGEGFREWSDRLREVEELLEDPELRAEAARIRDRARGEREAYTRHSQVPDWTKLKDMVADPIQELRDRVAEEVRRKESPDSLVPIDRDPVPPQFAEGVRRYYERLGSGR